MANPDKKKNDNQIYEFNEQMMEESSEQPLEETDAMIAEDSDEMIMEDSDEMIMEDSEEMIAEDSDEIIDEIIMEKSDEQINEENPLSIEEKKKELKEVKEIIRQLQKDIDNENFSYARGIAELSEEKGDYENRHKELAWELNVINDPYVDLEEDEPTIKKSEEQIIEEHYEQMTEHYTKESKAAHFAHAEDFVAPTNAKPEDFAAQTNIKPIEKTEDFDLARKVLTNISKSINELEKAKTLVNSGEYKNLIKYLKDIKDNKNLLSKENIKTTLQDIGRKIDKYIDHKAKDGVKANAYNKLAAIQKVNVWVSEAMGEIGLSRAKNYAEAYAKFDGEHKKDVPKPDKADLENKAEKKQDAAAKTIKYVDDCICTIILKADENKRPAINNVRNEFKGIKPKVIKDEGLAL